MNAIHTWGIVYDGGAFLLHYPNGEDQPWNRTDIDVPTIDRAVLYTELAALEADRYAKTPILDRLLHP